MCLINLALILGFMNFLLRILSMLPLKALMVRYYCYFFLDFYTIAVIFRDGNWVFLLLLLHVRDSTRSACLVDIKKNTENSDFV